MDKHNKIELGKEKPCIQRERRPTKKQWRGCGDV